MIEVGPIEPVVFRHEGRVLQVCMMDDGSLQIQITGRRNGKMYVIPESNNAVTIKTEKPGKEKAS